MIFFDWFYQNKQAVTYIIMVLYTLNIFAGFVHNDKAHVWYWASALSITMCVTWGYAGK